MGADPRRRADRDRPETLATAFAGRPTTPLSRSIADALAALAH